MAARRSKPKGGSSTAELADPGTKLRCFVSCAPGLETWLAEELATLDVEHIEVSKAGVSFRSGLERALTANLELGVGLHLLVRLARFPVRQLSQLDSWAQRAAWGRWFAKTEGANIDVAAHCHRSKIYHSGAVRERVESALRSCLGEGATDPGEREDLVPKLRLQLRLVDDLCTVSLDTSGTTLHKRGWRAMTSKAPLREDIARALLLASGWPREGSFLDPMCGSGTLAIEAAAMLSGQAPGLHRRFALERLACFDQAAWASRREELNARTRVIPGRIFAGDKNPEVLELARQNIAAAGLQEAVEFMEQPIEAWTDWRVTNKPLLVVTNPPWGKRLADAASPATMQCIGGLVRHAGPGSTASIVAPNRRLVDPTRLRFESRPKTQAGGLQVGLHLNGRAGKRASKNKS